MVEDIINEVLGYLKEKGPTNTFRLAGDIGLERHKLLHILEKLEEKGIVGFKHGLAMFLEFPAEEEEKPKPVEIKVSSPKLKKKVKPKKTRPKRKPAKAWQVLQTENKQLKEKLLEVEETMIKLEKKASAVPKTIIKKVPVVKTIIKKVRVVKEIPVPPAPKKKKKVKRKIKKRKVKKKKSKDKSKIKKVKKTSKKFKFPKFTFMKNIKQLKKPEFAKK